MLRTLLASLLGLACVLAPTVSAQPPASLTIRAARLIDGAGGVVNNAVVTVEGGRITRVGPADGPALIEATDVGHVGADGRLTAVRGFFDRVDPSLSA